MKNKQVKKIKVKNSKSIISFEEASSGEWKKWDRYLTIDHERAYYLGNICGTCQFLFERLQGANKRVSPNVLSQQLRNGINELDDILEDIIPLMPDEDYYVNLLDIKPSLIEVGSNNDYFKMEQIELWDWDVPHDPKINYYRGKSITFQENKELYEFIVPMFPQHELDQTTVNLYKDLFKEGVKPAAISISILDIKQYYDSNIEHWCLTHYLIDGHHKTFASSLEQQPLSLISFLAINKGISNLKQVELLLNFLKNYKGE